MSAVGQQIRYDFMVTNTGNVTLRNVEVKETEAPPASASSLSAVSCPRTTLAPGATVTCTATYTVTQADLDHGSIRDTATADAGAPSGSAVASAPSTVTVRTHAAAAAVPGLPETGAPWTGPLGPLLTLGSGLLILGGVWLVWLSRRRRKPARR